MSGDHLTGWTPRPRPGRQVLEGRFVRLEPLDPERHLAGLYHELTVADRDADRRFAWLAEAPPASHGELGQWMDRAAASADPLFLAVIDLAGGRVAGRQALMRIEPAHGVIEIGHIYWGPTIARTAAATEALYLAAAHVFDGLGYRRLEWKCNDLNAPSKQAALRFGFTHEGVFRQHMVMKGRNRDTAWFAMTDGDWARLKPGYRAWFDHLDAMGVQKEPLQAFLSASAG